mgnify:CR=1 FL=1
MKPIDVVSLFDGLPSESARRHLTNGLRNLFNFYEAQGYPDAWLNLLRKNLPKVKVGVDLWIPEPEDIAESLRRLKMRGGRYYALYNILLDSGLRLTEGIRLYNSLIDGDVQFEDHGGFSLISLGYLRGTKLAYYGFVTKFSLKLIEEQEKPLTYKKTMGVLTKKYGVKVSWKYLRKFANDVMTSEELNIPESVADFIEGRVPRTIGARHYMRLRRKAIGYYPRWVEYLTELRKKADV